MASIYTGCKVFCTTPKPIRVHINHPGAPKPEPGVLPRSPCRVCRPVTLVASTNLPTGDAIAIAASPEPDLSPAVAVGSGNTSKLVCICVSESALAHIETLAEAAPRTRDPAGKAQIDRLQQVLRRFGQTHIADSLVERAELGAEVARHARLREQFGELGGLAEAEERRADQSAELVTKLNPPQPPARISSRSPSQPHTPVAETASSNSRIS